MSPIYGFTIESGAGSGSGSGGQEGVLLKTSYEEGARARQTVG